MNIGRKFIKSLDVYKAVYRLRGARKAKRLILILEEEWQRVGISPEVWCEKDDKLTYLFVFSETNEGWRYWWRIENAIRRRR